MNLTGITEIIAGLVLKRKIAPSAVNASKLEQPYDQIITIMKTGDVSDVMDKLGFSCVNTATAAADALGDDLDIAKYLGLLDKISIRNEVGIDMEKTGKKLIRGDDIDVGRAYASITKLDNGLALFCQMDEVTPEDNMWSPTYLPIWDEYFGGVPKFGLTIIAGAAGGGKSTLLAQIMDAQTKQGKRFCLFSFEMTKEIYMTRWLQINPRVTKKQRSLVTITDASMDMDEAYARIAQVVASYPDVYSIGIDFADLMIPRGSTESTETASMIYLRMADIAKLVRKPVYLLCALSRNYVGGEPHVTDIRWSGMAEHDASLIALVYNPDQIHADMGQTRKKQRLPYVEGKAYIIEGKSRFGYKQGGIGAIQTDWLKERGWGTEASWWSLGG